MSKSFVGFKAALLGLVLVTGASAQAGISAPFKKGAVPAALADAVRRCNLALTQAADVAACPVARTYQSTSTITTARLQRLLERDLALRPRSATPQEAIQLLKDSLSPQLGALLANGETQAATGLAQARTDLSILVANAAKAGAQTLVDGDTYWAPSVNARAVILVERAKRRVTVILHGDTDG